MDLDNNRWKIEAGKVIWKGKNTPATGLKIKLIAKPTYDNNFKVMEIKLWQQGRGRFMRGGKSVIFYFSDYFPFKFMDC
jgi:hypothetical protein